MSREFEEINRLIIEEMKKAYSEKALDHVAHPHNIGGLEDASGYGEIAEPTGDSIQVWIKVEDGEITRTGFRVKGCSTLVAAGSAMTELVKGMRLDEAGELTGKQVLDALDGLPPGTEHCAEIAVDALREAIRACYLNELIKKRGLNQQGMGYLRLEL